MSSFLILLLSSLAVFRASELVAVDNGPFHIFYFIRKVTRPHKIVHEMLTCPYCCGGWISMWLTMLLWHHNILVLMPPLVWWFAIWGGQATILRAVRERA